MHETKVPCEHLSVEFDKELYFRLKWLSVATVRLLWPRFYGVCSCGFNGITYASTQHFLAGDW